MSSVTLKNLSKSFGEIKAVRELNLAIQQGEFFSLLGPSGCGKTTTLRMIAGFEFPTSGKILFDKKDVTLLAPNRRNTGMVFQSYALFPHMSVFENVAFGLKARKVPKPDIAPRVKSALTLVNLDDFQKRKVTELSGGQQQRVALARAIVIEPSILLLDEPLSNLDAKLREETRAQIRNLQQQLSITTIYVTHDQEEALSLSDRIAVMNHGMCHQVGTPEQIYKRPADTFVAQFVGNSNILKGRVLGYSNDLARVQITPDWSIFVDLHPNGALPAGQDISLSLKPEHIKFANDLDSDANVFPGSIRKVDFSGATVNYQVEVHGIMMQVKQLLGEAEFQRHAGGEVRLRILPSQVGPLH